MELVLPLFWVMILVMIKLTNKVNFNYHFILKLLLTKFSGIKPAGEKPAQIFAPLSVPNLADLCHLSYASISSPKKILLILVDRSSCTIAFAPNTSEVASFMETLSSTWNSSYLIVRNIFVRVFISLLAYNVASQAKGYATEVEIETNFNPHRSSIIGGTTVLHIRFVHWILTIVFEATRAITTPFNS